RAAPRRATAPRSGATWPAMRERAPAAAVSALPYDFALDPARAALVIIDMQRDFVEPGGFGESLGNDVSRLRAIIPTVAELLGAFRRAGLKVVHTREGHRADLSDCPPSKRLRGAPRLRI